MLHTLNSQVMALQSPNHPTASSLYKINERSIFQQKLLRHMFGADEQQRTCHFSPQFKKTKVCLAGLFVARPPGPRLSIPAQLLLRATAYNPCSNVLYRKIF